jgi:hypothetical protein
MNILNKLTHSIDSFACLSIMINDITSFHRDIIDDDKSEFALVPYYFILMLVIYLYTNNIYLLSAIYVTIKSSFRITSPHTIIQKHITLYESVVLNG